VGFVEEASAGLWTERTGTPCPRIGDWPVIWSYGQEELERAGAYRVYEDPADLLRHIDEVGGRPSLRTARAKEAQL